MTEIPQTVRFDTTLLAVGLLSASAASTTGADIHRSATDVYTYFQSVRPSLVHKWGICSKRHATTWTLRTRSLVPRRFHRELDQSSTRMSVCAPPCMPKSDGQRHFLPEIAYGADRFTLTRENGSVAVRAGRRSTRRSH